MAIIIDRWGNEIQFTDERWEHIKTGHPELSEYYEEIVATIKRGRRRQDAINPQKFKYYKAFDNLPMDYTHIVVVIRIGVRKFVITAYGIERIGR